MFSHPPKRCVHLEAEVTFADGTATVWKAPFVNGLGAWERTLEARYRRWRDNVVGHRLEYLWPDAARHVVRQFPDRSNPPVTVHLIRRWADIALPAHSSAGLLGVRVHDRWAPLEHAKSEIFFRYRVRPDDLR